MHKIIEGEYALPEFKLVKKWVAQEKVDGTNIRVKLSPNKETEFYGRTDTSEIPSFLLKRLQNQFPSNRPYLEKDLFFEGFGYKIQKNGSLYRDEVELCLIDVVEDGKWLSPYEVANYQYLCGSLSTVEVPIVGEFTLDEAIEFIKSEPRSIIAQHDCPMEGLVLKTDPVIFRDNGEPLYCKIKVRDYV